eukprot:5697237-Karenia_brevis.AAC.1
MSIFKLLKPSRRYMGSTRPLAFIVQESSPKAPDAGLPTRISVENDFVRRHAWRHKPDWFFTSKQFIEKCRPILSDGLGTPSAWTLSTESNFSAPLDAFP